MLLKSSATFHCCLKWPKYNYYNYYTIAYLQNTITICHYCFCCSVLCKYSIKHNFLYTLRINWKKGDNYYNIIIAMVLFWLLRYRSVLIQDGDKDFLLTKCQPWDRTVTLCSKCIYGINSIENAYVPKTLLLHRKKEKISSQHTNPFIFHWLGFYDISPQSPGKKIC